MSKLAAPSDAHGAGNLSLPVVGNVTEVTPQAAPPFVGEPPVVAFVSLGCAKNLVDSEKMLGQIAESGAILTGDEADADTVVVNTCGFLEASRREALEIIAELAERKRNGDLRRLVVAGCLVQRDGEKLRDHTPEIDALVGVNNRDDVVRAVWRMERDAATSLFLGDYHAATAPQWSDQGRLRLTPTHYAYVRVSEGCNQKCTFCTIPSIRGPMHCKTPDELVAECTELTRDGAREIILIGQDTTSYGHDIGYEPGLAGLLRRLDRDVIDARWIRLMYVYPSIFTDEMIAAIAGSERIVKYIDIPLQHVTDRMLKRMARRVTRAQTETLLTKLRERIPGVTIRTTFIVGFPGETEQDFAALEQFVRDFGFDAAGAFRYSLEPETPAGRMVEQLPAEVIQERYDRLMQTQQTVAFARARAQIGREFDVVIDGVNDDGVIVSRHAGQAPEVDSVCLLSPDGFATRENSDGDVLIDGVEEGMVLRVRCVGAEGYDLAVERT